MCHSQIHIYKRFAMVKSVVVYCLESRLGKSPPLLCSPSLLSVSIIRLQTASICFNTAVFKPTLQYGLNTVYDVVEVLQINNHTLNSEGEHRRGGDFPNLDSRQ